MAGFPPVSFVHGCEHRTSNGSVLKTGAAQDGRPKSASCRVIRDGYVELLRPTAHATPGLQKSTNFMEQELSRYAFIELFTEDDMNITTMQKLMKDVFSQGREEYCKLQVDLETNARKAVRPPTSTQSPASTTVLAKTSVYVCARASRLTNVASVSDPYCAGYTGTGHAGIGSGCRGLSWCQ